MVLVLLLVAGDHCQPQAYLNTGGVPEGEPGYNPGEAQALPQNQWFSAGVGPVLHSIRFMCRQTFVAAVAPCTAASNNVQRHHNTYLPTRALLPLLLPPNGL